MGAIVKKEFNDYGVAFDLTDDAWVYASDVAKYFDKRMVEYFRRPETLEFCITLAEMKYPEFNLNEIKDLTKGENFTPFAKKAGTEAFAYFFPMLVRTKRGAYGGTWMNRKLAIDFARWLNPKFAIWMVDVIDDLIMYGRTNSSFVDKIVLNVPAQWRRLFPTDFFEGLMKSYGLDYDDTKNTPQFVGSFINKYVYSHVWEGLPGEIKERRKEFAETNGLDENSIRLHQFLQDNAKDVLNTHIYQVTGLLKASGDIRHFESLFDSAFNNRNQLRLHFKKNPKRLN